MLVFFREKKWSTRTLILGSLIFLFVEAMFQLFRISGVNAALAADGVEANYGVFLVRSFTMSSLDCKGGGFIGALLAWPLYKALDVWGGMIVLIFATAIVLMAMTGFSFGGIGMRISEWIDDFRVDMQERREEKDALRDARQEEGTGTRERAGHRAAEAAAGTPAKAEGRAGSRSERGGGTGKAPTAGRRDAQGV